MNGLARDLRGAFRVFRRSPGFALVVVAIIAIGVGGVTAVFSVVRGVVLSPLSFANSERVVMVWGQSSEYPRAVLTVGDYNDLVSGVRAFETTAASWSNTSPLLGTGEPEHVSVGWVMPGYFEMLGVRPLIGRTLQADDAGVLLSNELWTRRYGADATIVGRSIDLGGTSMEVIGVLPGGVDPNLTTFGGARAQHQIWRVLPSDWIRGNDRSVGWLRSAALLRSDVTLDQAQAEVDAVMSGINATVSGRDGGDDMRMLLIPVRDDLVGGLSQILWIMLGAVGGVLLIAASNVAHLMLGRAQQREGELAVRAALGGGRARLLRQLMLESATLAAVGGLAGVLLGWSGLQLLLRWAPSTLPRLDEVRLDAHVLAIALAATAIAAMLFGIVPAVRSTRSDISQVLGDRRSTSSVRRQRVSRGLVIAEVALSLGLLMGTGLLVRSLTRLNAVDLGFEKKELLTMRLVTTTMGSSPDEGAAILTDYVDRIRAIPGVQAVGVANRLPLAGGLFTGTFRSEEMVVAADQAMEASYRWVTPGYFQAMGTAIRAGRPFRPGDGLDVVLIDEKAANRAWPGQNAVGRRIEIASVGADPTWAEVIGVVAATRHADVSVEARETVFMPMLAAAHQQPILNVAIRVAGNPMSFIESIRSAVRAVDGNTVVARIRPMTQLYAESTASTRFAMSLLALFSGVALLLAAVGLYGVMTASVMQRMREFGIRMALGATHQSILRGVMRAGATLVLLGIACGAVLSLLLGRFLSAQLFSVSSTDLVTLVGASTVMLFAGLVGAYLPARVALSVDPVVTLREE